MLRPSYTELMNILNEDSDLDNKITSRYSIVIAVAKRARQIIDGAPIYSDVPPDKAVSVAVDEMNRNRIKTFPDMNNIPEAYLPLVHKYSNNEKTEKESEKYREKSFGKGFSGSDGDLFINDDFPEVPDMDLDLDMGLNLGLSLDELIKSAKISDDDEMEMEDFDDSDDFPDDLPED